MVGEFAISFVIVADAGAFDLASIGRVVVDHVVHECRPSATDWWTHVEIDRRYTNV